VMESLDGNLLRNKFGDLWTVCFKVTVRVQEITCLLIIKVKHQRMILTCCACHSQKDECRRIKMCDLN
jgi:hypothetical protein